MLIKTAVLDEIKAERISLIFRRWKKPGVKPGGTQLTQSGLLAIDSGPDSKFYEWFAETVRTLLPPMLAMGIVQPGEIEIDTLASRIREEAISKQASIAAPILIECFARKP